MSTEKLIESLKAVEADAALQHKEWLTDGAADELPEALAAVLILADGVLITPSGSCNLAAHRALAEAGFPVSCGEKDSFGWLTGVICTSKGRIVYG